MPNVVKDFTVHFCPAAQPLCGVTSSHFTLPGSWLPPSTGLPASSTDPPMYSGLARPAAKKDAA